MGSLLPKARCSLHTPGPTAGLLNIAIWMQGFKSHREFTGREPDAVVFSSFLWDMQRWGKFFPEKLTERGLSTETIEEWAHNLEAVFALIKVSIMLCNPRPGAWAHLAHCHVCLMPACFNVSLPVFPVLRLCSLCASNAYIVQSSASPCCTIPMIYTVFPTLDRRVRSPVGHREQRKAEH